MGSLRALEEWCRTECASYPSVEIKNTPTSFRDGLAFCAVIHKHRPDLIDFSSLSKDNVYENNKLAFEVAETKLGIPALLDAKDMVSSVEPDRLSVVTYLSQYHYFFTKKCHASLPSLESSRVTELSKPAKSKPADGVTPPKTSPDHRPGREVRQYTGGGVCALCRNHVHLVQRHLAEGKVYHRSCFRCQVCSSTLLPGSYTQGSSAGSLICTHHITANQSVRPDLSRQIGSAENLPNSKGREGSSSRGGLSEKISSLPRYAGKTESQDRLVRRGVDTEGGEKNTRPERGEEVKGRDNRDPTVGSNDEVKRPPPPPCFKDRAPAGAGKAEALLGQTETELREEATKSGGPSGLTPTSPGGSVSGVSGRPVPAPRRTVDSSKPPVPAPRTKTLQRMGSSSSTGNSPKHSKSPPSSIHSQAGVSRIVKSNHPWMNIVHSGPWTQLPPAPPPMTPSRSTSAPAMRKEWFKPRVAPPNPFGDGEDEETNDDTGEDSAETDAANQSKPSDATSQSGNDANPSHKSAGLDEASGLGSLTDIVSELGVPDLAGAAGGLDIKDLAGVGPMGLSGTAGALGTSDVAQGLPFPKSASVSAISSAFPLYPFLPADLPELSESQLTPAQSKQACKENPFDRQSAIPKSKTFQAPLSTRAPAPGYGFPLIKRKVQTDPFIPIQNLQEEMGELDKRMETLELRGVELEKSLRSCQSGQEDEEMLVDWFRLIHEKHLLVRRDAELVYLTKQQTLEERQADVEYDLRCLLNRPESEWSQEDKGREQQLMGELVTIIEQRNQIISGLDQDRQREKEEDMLLEAVMKRKDLQKEGLKDPRKSRGKFKPMKMLNLLSQKAESPKDSKKKS